MTRPTQHPAGNSEARKRALTVVPCCDAAAKVARVEALIEDLVATANLCAARDELECSTCVGRRIAAERLRKALDCGAQ